MFLGMVPEIKKRLNVPVVCGFTGEDLFLEDLEEPYQTETLALMQERSRDIDALISPSSDIMLILWGII